METAVKKLSKGQQLKQVQREFDELKLAIKRYVEGAQREVVALREENARLKEIEFRMEGLEK